MNEIDLSSIPRRRLITADDRVQLITKPLEFAPPQAQDPPELEALTGLVAKGDEFDLRFQIRAEADEYPGARLRFVGLKQLP